jgi:multiple sugar transport system ATP-binding protein
VISGRVRLIEHMGSDVFVHVEMPGASGLFVVRLPLERTSGIQLGELLELGLRPGQLLFFDADGRRIRTSSSVTRIERRAFG